MDMYNQLFLVEFKDNITDLIDGFLETCEDGKEEQDIRELKSQVFEEVIRVFYSQNTVEYFKELENNV